MADVIHFMPQNTLTAADNLNDFIRMCRDDLTIFGEDLDWSAWQWPGVNFTKIGVRSRGINDANRMDDAFLDFAKAYYRYSRSCNSSKTPREMMALRSIEIALLQVKGTANIQELDITVLDEAACIARRNYSPEAAYTCGHGISRLARFVTENRLIKSAIGTWKNPIMQPSRVTIQTGPKAKAIQNKKLPSTDALEALAELFANNPQNPRDIFTSSTFAMLMCAPSRITEILELPVDCEVEEPDATGAIRYGWRFFSGKGYEGDIKWIPVVMVPVAKEAIRRIRHLTEESRKLACWIENHPDKPYRHANCPNVLDNAPLKVFQACEFLGLSSSTRLACTSSLGNFNLATRDGAHTLESLWQYAMTRQPKGFPWLNKQKKIKFSNALFCLTRNALNATKGTSPLILWAPKVGAFNHDLHSEKPASSFRTKSIFERHGYKATDGTPLKVTSHQARHLLNTIGNRGGLSQEQLAKWSGRADIKQNRVYNHMSEYEMVALAEALDTTLTCFGPQGVVSPHPPITTQEINLMERGPIHITEFGICVHDYTMSPCEKFRDCLNCQEQICIKGEDERLQRIKARLSQVEVDFSQAKKAVQNGFSGADRWYQYHEKTVSRLRQLIDILENTEIPNGAQIKLRDGKDYSHLRRAIRTKAAEALEKKASDADLLSEMSLLLGGGLG